MDQTAKPTTSPQPPKAAPSGVRASAPVHRAAIFGEIATSLLPLAAEQIAQRCDLTPEQVMRRLSDLQDDGMVRKTSLRHENRSGLMAAKWTTG